MSDFGGTSIRPTRRELGELIVLALALKAASLLILYYGWVFIPRASYEVTRAEIPVSGVEGARSCADKCELDTWMTRPGTTFRENLAGFDGAWFIRVAALGYRRLAEGNYNLASEIKSLNVMDQLGYDDGKKLYGYRHWPAMPAMMRFLAPVVGGYLNAGLVVANGFYFLLAYFLYRLVRLDYSHRAGLLAVALISLHPGAWSLTAVFNESPFLAAAAGAVAMARERRWIASGVLGMFMATLRPDAIVVMIPILYEYLSAREPAGIAPFSSVLRFSNIIERTMALFRKPSGLALLLIPAGTILTLAYYQHIAGTPFAFALAHETGSRGYVNLPWEELYNTFMRGRVFQLKEIVFHAITWVFIFASLNKGRRGYLLWLIVFAVFHTLHSAHSFSRYHLQALPVFILGAAWLEDRPAAAAVVFGISAAVMAVFAAMFINGYWIA